MESEWRGLTKKGVREANEFAQNVVKNANALEEHSQASLKRVGEWVEELRAALGEQEQRILNWKEQLSARKGEIGKFEDALKNGARHAGEYQALQLTLQRLRETKLEPWLCSDVTVFAEGDAATDDSLFVFVDNLSIENLQSSIQRKQTQIEKFRDAFADGEGQIKELDEEVHRQLRRIFPAQSTSITEEKSNGFQQAMACLNFWLAQIESAVKQEANLCYIMSEGSLGLGALHNHFLRDSFASVEAESHAEAPIHSNLVEDLRSIASRLAQFLANDFEGAFSSAQSPDPQGSNSFSDSGIFSLSFSGIGFDDSNNLQSLASILRDSTRKCPEKFKQGLKKMAGLVDMIKTLSLAVSGAKQQFTKCIIETIDSIVTKTTSAQQEGRKLIEKAEETEHLIETEAAQFNSLQEHYGNFIKAHGSTLEEIKRRWTALAHIEELARKYQSEINALVEDECQARQQYYCLHGQYLPLGYCPALAPEFTDTPTNFQFVLANSEDAQVLHDCVKKMDLNFPRLSPPSMDHERESSEPDCSESRSE